MDKNIRREFMKATRHKRIRRKVTGTMDRPRLVVFRSARNISVQVIDDAKGVTLASASSLDKDLQAEVASLRDTWKGEREEFYAKLAKAPAEDDKGGKKKKGKKDKAPVATTKKTKQPSPNSLNVRIARIVGEAIAKRCGDKQIEKVVFDRSGYKYHGRVQTLAEAARKAGLQF